MVTRVILSLKGTAALSLSFVLLGAIVVFGLKTVTLTEETDEGAVMVEATKFPLRLTMILNKTTFKLNDTEYPVIWLSVENIGNKTLNMTMYEDNFNLVIYDEFGSEVFDGKKYWFHPAIDPPMPLPPGLSRGGGAPWYEYKEIPPGRYQIVGQFISHYLNLVVETPPITITIIP